MKINLNFLFFILISILFISNLIALSDKEIIDQCKNNCQNQKKSLIKEISNEHKSCITSCSNQEILILNSCKNNCKNSSNKVLCLRTCIKDFLVENKTWNLNVCKNNCSSNMRFKMNEIQINSNDCLIGCNYKPFNKEITCENGKYNASETFIEDCKICKCNFNGNLTCKPLEFCGLSDFLSDEQLCSSNGGFYYPICKGIYYDITCSSKSYCLCEGLNNYACPEGYICLKDFKSLILKHNTVSGFKTLLGFNLGEIGICTKKPELPNCGNNICENIYSQTNKIPETILNCPIDCKK